MRFDAQHRFHGTPDAVAAILADPGFYVGLRLPDLSQPEVLESPGDGPRGVLRLRYLFVGSLDAMVRRLLGKRQLAWIQEIHVDRPTSSGDLKYQAEADPKRLHGSAHFTLQADGPGCVQQLHGELVVAVPIVGARAERQIVAGLLRRLDIEADHLNAILGES
jgi:hypothetical protein